MESTTLIDSTATGKQHILAFVDAPDPDNFVQIIALVKLNPDAIVHVVLTGRPVRFGASRDHALWQWDPLSSRMAQEASALRAKNFLRHFGVTNIRIFDGGIAPRTLVPHWIHFAEYYKFLDCDPLQAIRHSELESQEELGKLLFSLAPNSVQVAIGGPMTGLYQLLVRCPEIANRFSEVHAMFATWGNVKLMQFDDKPRDPKQFNVACDPQAAHAVLLGLTCPIYLMPTEVTRVQSIGFQNAQKLREALPQNSGTIALYNLYALWYDAAVRPRQDKNPEELIFIHDLVAALSLNEAVRKEIYEVTPIKITRVPHLVTEQADWGKVDMKPTRSGRQTMPRYAATGLTACGAEAYLRTLKTILA
ncbi:MAG: nucleoside hydrolase [Candidatus Melainabacteria bacterium]|nr:nucleoside hydrolase [Candidatus Melainabacteria bacterium]